MRPDYLKLGIKELERELDCSRTEHIEWEKTYEKTEEEDLRQDYSDMQLRTINQLEAVILILENL